ncbi:hypothetical protein Q0590_17975 [Rhodocytophaga aerolata]|uniref:Uncharacterized protein n=1 Tax=Rhodocytophaga aerolata TaxID=455078 RepID=A0ABT8RBN2_9BACT|nr:hypothetical protein [Rhodocytophaga aerolata]MDO1448167.1 hypothetical protein [Rhodocytophaga aerolata]
MKNYDLINYQVVKATSIKELQYLLEEKIRLGLTPLGIPSIIHIRNKWNERMAVFYQSVAYTGVIPAMA